MGAEPLTEQEEKEMKRKVTKPRPGHADLNGAIKYGHRDMRNVLERSSARETTVRVLLVRLLKGVSKLGIKVAGHVVKLAVYKLRRLRIVQLKN